MFRRLVPAVIGGALVLLVAACGSSDNPTAAAPASSVPPSANRAGGPAASGTVAALAQSSIEVQNPSAGQVTVNYSGNTTFTDRVSGTLADVTTGSCVLVSGTGQPLTAQTVEITPASANGCAAGFGGNGGGARPQNGNTGRPSRTPRPSGTNAGDRAFGSVTAVSATGFTVRQDNRQTGATTDVSVTVGSSTTYTKTQSADSSALKVGECVVATGQADDTGAVAAKTIAISLAGPNGCTGGFRRPGGTNG